MKLAIVLVAFLGSIVVAQDAPRFKTGAEVLQKSVPKRESLVGKTLWFVPNPKQIAGRYGFQTSASYQSRTEKLYPENPIKIQVVEEIQPSKDTIFRKYLKVLFEDGTSAYMDEYVSISDFTPETPLDDSNVISLELDLGSLVARESYSREKFFVCDPKLLVAKLNDFEAAKKAKEVEAAAKQKKAAAAWKARGGVKIGMTKDQVLASNWGKPTKINRTIREGVVHEQWVYGSHSYLYFDNGILTTIQN